jgi:hypothetical protein
VRAGALTTHFSRPTVTASQFAHRLPHIQSRQRVNGAGDVLPAPFAQGEEVLGYKLIDIVVVAIV